MSRRTPQEKKRLEYDRDHYVEAERPHLFRNTWPKKKAHANRRDRRRAERLLEGLRNLPADFVVAHADDSALTAEHVANAHPRRALWKAGVRSLRERVARRNASWARRVGYNFFMTPYSSALHREPFAAFLDSVVAGAGPGSASLAAALADALEPAVHAPWVNDWRHGRRAWLLAFFRDEPTWEPRLRSWLDARLGDGPRGASAGGSVS